jgi:hypothetical protein
LRDQLAEKIRDILLALRHERFFVASSTPESHDHGFGGSWQCSGLEGRARK